MTAVRTVSAVVVACVMLLAVVSAQAYFQAVNPTGVPYAIVVQSAIWNDGPSLQAGDEVAVFDGNLCVGAAVVNTFPVIMTAWEAVPGLGLQGFTAGHLMTYKVWDQSANLEQAALAHYQTGDATFGGGFGSAVDLYSDDFPVLLAIWSNQTTVPAGGGSLPYGVQLWSTVGVTHTGLRFWTKLRYPNGSLSGVQFQVNFNLTPFLNIASTSLHQNIGAGAASGTYQLIGYVGEYPNPSLTDYFTFTKLAAGEAEGGGMTVPQVEAAPEDESLLPGGVILSAYPNPFNAMSTISLTLPEASQMDVRVHDLLGREVSRIARGAYSQGTHTFTFDATALPSGVYFVSAAAGQDVKVYKLMLMK